MSATIRPISFLHTQAQQSPRAAAIAVRWEISTPALLASPGAAILNGQASKLRSCALVVHIDQHTARAELALELTTGEHSTIDLHTAAPVERGGNDAIMSVDAPNILSLTVRNTGDSPEILYARTPLLERALGLPGGVYDAPTIA